MSDTSATREDLKRVLDDIFQRILRDGERERALRDSGAPPWTPEPQVDPQYEGLEMEEWDSVLSPPERLAEDWRFAVMMNAQEDVRVLLDDALEQRRLDVRRDTVDWRRLSRLALIVAAHAHKIDAMREEGDYSARWPTSADIPLEEMPGQVRPDTNVRPDRPVPILPAPAVETLQHRTVPRISESFSEFMRIEARWNAKGAKQATVAIGKFVSLMDDRLVNDIRQGVAEEFRIRMKKMPKLFGKSIYKGMSAMDALTAAERLRAAIAATPGSGPVPWNKREMARAEASRLAVPMAMKTVNRDFSFLTSWGSFMEKNDDRRMLLHNQKCPFAGQAFTKKEVRTEAQKAGRLRRPFTLAELTMIYKAPLFQEPSQFEPATDGEVHRQQARFWSIMIGLYAGLRLGEIAQLRPSDIEAEDGIPRISLRSDGSRTFKTEAGDRDVPLHPILVNLGLLEFARLAARAGFTQLLPGMKDKGGQHGASISVWFTKFRRELGVDSVQTVFHSFRHCFATAIRSKRGTDEVLIDRIVGHEDKGSVRTRYVDNFPLSLKAEAVTAIDYKIDLSHILSWARRTDRSTTD